MNRVGFVVGGQNQNERQRMVDEYQDGKLDIILITVRSGGVGLSLHHDRPTTKPRHVVTPIPWSAIDLVQFLGRGHRLTSLSPTTQESLLYNNTVETEKVFPVLKNKVKCLSKCVTAKEQFCTLFEPENEDVNMEESDEINEAETEQREANKSENVDDVDSGNESGYEGLESVDGELPLPTSYR
jgi:hypothetical protein